MRPLGGWWSVSPEMERMLESEGLHNLTEGILDATMLPLLRVWDWKVVHERLPEPDEVGRAPAGERCSAVPERCFFRKQAWDLILADLAKNSPWTGAIRN